MRINRYQDQLLVTMESNLSLNRLPLLHHRINQAGQKEYRFLCLDFGSVVKLCDSHYHTILEIQDSCRINGMKMIITGLCPKQRNKLLALNPSPDLTILDHLLMFDDNDTMAARRSG
jgi:anti-anti-sigma regulatory factor